MRGNDDDRGFFETLLGDGRSLIKLTALALIGAGAFALFQRRRASSSRRTPITSA